jgi:integrase
MRPQLLQGVSIPSTVGEGLIVVLERALAARSPSAYDLESRARYLAAHVERPAAEVTPGWLAAQLRDLHRSGLAPSTVRGVASVWLAVLAECQVAIDSRLLRLPRIEHRTIAERAPLSLTELARVVRSVACPRWQLAAVVAGCLTGARAGELCGWRVGDYDRTEQVLRWAEQARQRGARARGPTKDRAAREVPVHAELVPYLEEAADGRAPGDPLLWRPVGKRLAAWTGNDLLRAWTAVCEAHGLARRTSHAGRYTLPTLLLEAGAAPLAVRALTHPATIGRAAEGGPRAGYDGSWGRYVGATLDARRAAVATLRLPPAEVISPRQLTLF